jgi:serine/threonine-protein kinase
VTLGSVGGTPSGVHWGANGILLAQPGTGIVRMPETGGKPEVVIAVNDADLLAHGPQELPGGRVLFTVARRTGNQFSWDGGQIVVQSLKTGERKTIIDGGSDGRYVPTGHLVYAVSGTLFAVPFDVKTLAVTGSAVPIVEGVGRATSITGGGTQFSFSQTGSIVYLPGPAAAGGYKVLVFDRKEMVDELKLAGGTYANPRVSPDGKRLALETSDGRAAAVSIYELTGTASLRRLTFGGSNRFPVWSPDGRHVAFQSDRDGDRAVFWQPPDGGIAERLTKPAPGVAHLPESWSADGATLLYSEAKGSEHSLWMLSIRDRTAVQFPDLRSINFPPLAVVSPDGHWVAYQVGEATLGEGTLFVEPFPPTGTKYQIARGGRPAWSRDGSELFFVPAPGQFMGVAVATKPAFSFGNPVAIPRRFGTADPISPRPYDVMPDGRFVGVGAAAQIGPTGPAQIQVVLNWFEELKARAPVKK